MCCRKYFIPITVCILLLVAGLIAFTVKDSMDDERIISHMVDPKNESVSFYWKDNNGQIIRSIKNLKTHVENNDSELIFATNGGMYDANRSPQGLFIENGHVQTPLDTVVGNGNFYLMPNGVFYITSDNEAFVCKTDSFVNDGSIKFATQSGPMLLIDGQIHPSFKEGSENVHIRNGVGMLPNKKIVFAMSKTKVNFYDFASYFQSLGCKNALYFDGYVSRTYLPEKNWVQTDGDFGVIIGITKQ